MHLEVLELLETLGAHAARVLLASVWPLDDLYNTLAAPFMCVFSEAP